MLHKNQRSLSFIIFIFTIFLVNLNCDFETDTCSWKNEKFNGQQDWILNKGKTPSAGTGPLADHTKKTQQGDDIVIKTFLLFKKNKKLFYMIRKKTHPYNMHNTSLYAHSLNVILLKKEKFKTKCKVV